MTDEIRGVVPQRHDAVQLNEQTFGTIAGFTEDGDVVIQNDEDGARFYVYAPAELALFGVFDEEQGTNAWKVQ